MSNPEKEFKECDRDGKGLIDFSEFCDWAIGKQLDIETLNDDDEDKPIEIKPTEVKPKTE